MAKPNQLHKGTGTIAELRIPFMQHIENNVEWFENNPASVTVDNVESALSGVGRVNGPALLFDLFMDSGILTTGILAATIGGVWTGAEYPERAMDQDTWNYMFALAGYTVDGKPAELPTGSLPLYRGSTAEGKAGMCWTDCIETAQTFATGQVRGRAIGTLWTATVEPERLLARINDRQESEYVVNTDGLKITEAQL